MSASVKIIGLLALFSHLTDIQTTAQHVAASPLRVVVVTGYQEVSTNVRIGHEENHDPSLFSPIPPSFIEPDSPIRTSSRRRPCHAASSISDKTLEITNAFRKWLGLPVVHKDSKEDATAELVRILPVMPVKTYGVDGKDTGANRIPILPMGWSHLPPHDGEHREEHHDEHHGKHHGKHHKKHHDRPFWKRVHHALMSLGPWEGRAVAFVLGKLSLTLPSRLHRC